MRLFPAGTWIETDIAKLDTKESWYDHLNSIDIVINAAGALQSGLKDDVDAIHYRAIAALLAACEMRHVQKFVQISAVGADLGANTEFMRSKARGDDRVRHSRLNWVILRPGLVIGANAYGGTALLRMVASIPVVLPIVFGDRLVQTVAVSDLAAVVHDAVEDRIPSHAELDIVEDHPHSLRSVLIDLRSWLGMQTARKLIDIPEPLALAAARIADGLGYLGWRSPLRTTTMRVLSGNVVGNAQPFRAVSERMLSNLNQTLARLPSTVQERWFARMYLLLPVIVAVLSAFWMVSGAIAFVALDAAAAQSGLAARSARSIVAGGALIDVCLGAFILFRPWARAASWGMVIVGLGYLVVGSMARPDLWADPLGPLLKILPATVLAFVAATLLDSGR
jgi:uncharacterized protein YbjT (DUF2867 family)